MTGLVALSAVVTVASGVTAGILVGVALSVVPALREMPRDRFVYTHDMLGRRWDPTMPLLVLSTTAAEVVLACLASGGTRPLFAVGAGLLVIVSIISHWANRPINRRIRALDPEAMPPDWTDPRPLWGRWHRVRTVAAVGAATVNAVALGLL